MIYVEYSKGATFCKVDGGHHYPPIMAQKMFLERKFFMALRALAQFLEFNLTSFLAGKRLFFVKTAPWIKDGETLGSKVIVQIFHDATDYGRADISNFGEQLTIKVRKMPPESFSPFKPLQTEVVIKNVEKAQVYGDFHNNLSIIATIAAKNPDTDTK